MRFAYADPPYLGLAAKFYGDKHPEAAIYDGIDAHRDLITRLCDEYADGWVLSMTSGNLFDILPLCPRGCRVGAWVKPFASFKPGVGIAYAWEPVVFKGGRKKARNEPTLRDWCAVSITLRRGLTGTKPRGFCRWVFGLLNAQPGDTMHDLFPGSNAVGHAWAEWAGEPEEQVGMFAPAAE